MKTPARPTTSKLLRSKITRHSGQLIFSDLWRGTHLGEEQVLTLKMTNFHTRNLKAFAAFSNKIEPVTYQSQISNNFV